MQSITEDVLSLEELLNNRSIHLPLQRQQGEDYLHCLHRVIFDGYLAKLKKLDSYEVDGKEYKGILVEGAASLAESIIETIKTYHQGNLAVAYQQFKSALDEIDRKIRQETRGDSVLFVNEKVGNLYRIRYETSPLTDRKDLFHIPMKERENVPTQRFSIAGNPSLYMGSTLFICWKESGLPEIWDCYASRYEIVYSDHVFLDIRNWLPRFQKELPQDTNGRLKLFNYLCLWPLVAACSVKVKYTGRPFKPEYIISQLLYQYTSELKSLVHSDERHVNVLGLLYSSTRLESWEDFDPETEYNLAIPVLQADSEAFSSELKEILHLTCPISWKKVLNSSDSNHQKLDISAEHYFHQIGRSFSRMERLLERERVARVDSDKNG